MDFEERLNKPKRKLTEKQLKALAEGRKKQKIKREKEIIIETKHRQRKERIEREKVLNEQEEIKIYNKLMKRGNDKIREWKQIKYRHLDRANNIKEYNELKTILDTIDEEDVLTGNHIEKLQQGVEQYKPKNPDPDSENEPDDETEEIPPNSPPPEEPIQLLIDPRDI